MVSIGPGDFGSADAVRLTGEYHAELGRRFPADYDPASGLPATADALRPPSGIFLVARVDTTAVGCGGLKTIDSTTGEIKHMFLMPAYRGRGIGAALLEALEHEGQNMGFERLVLDTSEYLQEAIGLYQRSGFVETDAYNSNRYATHWFEKHFT